MMPGDDLKRVLEDLLALSGFKSGIIVCMVGSLDGAVLRMSNGRNKNFKGLFEIVSGMGTISTGGIHVHISISDVQGIVYGGHLLEGCKIYTTAEIVLVESCNYIFTREKDGSTPWKELQIKKL